MKKEEIIKKVAKEILEKIGIKADVSVFETDDNNFVCNIEVDDASLIIGKEGESLQALQHLARMIVRKNVEEKIKFILDINSYKKEKNESVISFAKKMAQKAVDTQKPVALRPMSAYERRLVHLALRENDKVETESVGEGSERKVIIKAISHI